MEISLIYSSLSLIMNLKSFFFADSFFIYTSANHVFLIWPVIMLTVRSLADAFVIII